MRIGVFCTNEYTTPPPRNIIYAPLVVSQQIADGLTARGHNVTVYAPKGSRTTSHLNTTNLPPLYKNPIMKELITLNLERAVSLYELIALSELLRDAQKGKFDIIHIHPVLRGIFFGAFVSVPLVFTMHDPIIPSKEFIYSHIPKKNINLVAISQSQRKSSPRLPWVKTIYNGIDLPAYPFQKDHRDYIAFVGRLHPAKGVHEAIQIAKKTGVRLKIAGGPARGKYWEQQIKPFLNSRITYEGVISPAEVPAFIGHAKALLFPIQWEEPFGLVMIESMACGTPVIATKHGSVLEVVRHGVTGFIGKTTNELAGYVKRIDTIDRKACRVHVEKHFTQERMIDEYEKLFIKLARTHGKTHRKNRT